MDELRRRAALLVEQALGEVEAIRLAVPQSYADLDISNHPYNARRKMTMKDAKPKATRAAALLRQAGELLDPIGKAPHG